jgi:hypothetical protein
VWEATAGRLEGRDAQARWELAGVRAGTYAAIVKVTDSTGASADCLVRVIVRRDGGTRGPLPESPRPQRETGGALLVQGQAEAPGYGLYSYLLLGGPPTEVSRERYLKAIGAYWTLVPEIASLEQYLPRRDLNVAYLPVKVAPTQSVSTEWILEQHDYARSRSLLRALPGTLREGPYIVSTMKPLGGTSERPPALSGQYLFQDLSSAPPHLVSAWVKEFLNQAAQERFWEPRTAEQLALKLRMTIGVLGVGLPEVRKALDSWIAWVRPAG